MIRDDTRRFLSVFARCTTLGGAGIVLSLVAFSTSAADADRTAADDGPPPAAAVNAASTAPTTAWTLGDFAAEMQRLHGRSYERGRQLFARAHCAVCHGDANELREFGPNLTKLDPRFQPLDILRDILDPSRRIADAKYDVWTFETDDGRAVAGMILEETARRVRVMDKPLQVAPATEINKAEIVERKPSPASMMPQGLLNQLTRDEIIDLVAYVAARGDAQAAVVQPPAPPQPKLSPSDLTPAEPEP